MLVRMVVLGHALSANDAIQKGAFIEVCKGCSPRPCENVTRYLQNVVGCTGLLGLPAVLRLCVKKPAVRKPELKRQWLRNYH